MLFTADELKQLAGLTPEVETALARQALPAPPPDTPYHMLLRAGMSMLDQQIAETYGPSEDSIIEEDKDVALRDGSPSKVRVFKPSVTPADGSPLFVWIFGGGFAGGSRFQALGRARHLVKLFGAVVVSLEYRLAPEHPFPESHQDCWDQLKWVDKHADALGANTKLGFVVGGVSAGANITAVLVRRSQVEEPLDHAITGQWLENIIVFGSEETVPERYRHLWLSREQCLNAPVMSTTQVDMIAGFTQWVPSSSWFTPVAYKKSFEGIPPTYFSVDGADPLRDDALIYDELLKADGVKTRVDLYPGCPHAHATTLAGTDVAAKAETDAFIAAGWLLGREISTAEVVAAAPKKQIQQ